MFFRSLTFCAPLVVSGLLVTSAVNAHPGWAAATAAPAPSAATATVAAPATAGGWQRFHAQSFTAAAGALCPFALHSQVLFDREYVRTTAAYPDGSPRVQQFVGPLVVRVTNQGTGRSVRRDLSARAVVRYAPDGSFDFQLDGPAAVGFHPGDSQPPGFYVLRGRHVVHFAKDGTRTLTLDQGSEENLCTTLT